MKIDLPDGAWASLRDPKKVPERLRRPIAARFQEQAKYLKVLNELTDATPEDVAAKVPSEFLAILSDLNDDLIVAMVEEWSLEVPITADGVLDLPGDVYDALQHAVAPFVLQVLPDFGPNPDPKALTAS